MIKDGRIAGRAVLLAGQPGTGKTAIAMARRPPHARSPRPLARLSPLAASRSDAASRGAGHG